MIAVIAGTQREFSEYCRVNNLKTSEAVYIWDKRALAGMNFTKFVRVGTWYLAPAEAIKEFEKRDLFANHRVPKKES
jgi:hypothetical protein